MSFALSWFTSGFVGEKQRGKEGLRAGGMPLTVFNEFSGSHAGNKREKAGGQCWQDGLAWKCILLICRCALRQGKARQGKTRHWSYCGSC